MNSKLDFQDIEPALAALVASEWSCTSFGATADIELKSRRTGEWITVATVYSIEGCQAEDVANLMVMAVRRSLQGPLSQNSDVGNVSNG